MTVSIGLLQPDEEPAFCELFQRVFSVEMTPAWRRWKYAQGPRLGAFSLVARDASARLVGHAGALVFPGWCGGQSVPMAQVCDVMVDPVVRGGLDPRGVYGLLMAALQQQLARAHPGVFAYGFAGVRPYKLGARLGWYRCVQECRMGGWADRRTLWGAAAAAPAAGPGVAWPWRWRADATDFDDPVFERLGQLQRRFAHQAEPCGPQVHRTAAYLRWRYADHPLHRYRPWRLSRWGRGLGWMVTRPMPDGRLVIVDSLWPAALRSDAAVQALARAVGSSDGDRLGAWFIDTPQRAALEPIMACEVRVDGWHSDSVQPRFQPGDTDVF